MRVDASPANYRNSIEVIDIDQDNCNNTPIN